MDAIILLRAGYLFSALAILVIFLIPALNARFLAYGLRNSPIIGTSILDQLASLRVPHGWFTSFYVVSTASSVFWLAKYLTLPPSTWSIEREPIPLSRLTLAWTCLLIQGFRRLYESLNLPPSKSTMWIGHWVLGILFYLTINISIWIEGIDTLKSHKVEVEDFRIGVPSVKTFVALVLFTLASGVQNDCHSYLASLKIKGAYQLPLHPAFRRMIAPHFTAECVIYFALSMLAAPRGRLFNGTLACACVFVGVNLGVTAHGTREWYVKTFGKESVRGRWRLVPGMF
ncbi:hypothetical protein K470DRAFT_259955 [Piedraia hortae CBS 480.64]|uniref:Polyprenal reductase n=1 Tax=Piedraia hortae CBS 480.64 TaxID=1314780 RepID=A0A6A7BUW1_9PEZI|nr:hypothetical protein K470DRAFT_259955 [Piedraia hortae CBS 480.64]